MDADHVYNLRHEYQSTTPGLPLVLYLDLPPEKAEEWQLHKYTVMALNRTLSQAVAFLLDSAVEDELAGLNDEAVRAIRFLLRFTVTEQSAWRRCWRVSWKCSTAPASNPWPYALQT